MEAHPLEGFSKDSLYRSIAFLKLSNSEEGYGLFQELQKNEAFSRLPAEMRGKLLAILYQVYAKVQDIKKAFRYYPETDPDDKLKLPVQYRRIRHLTSYLASPEASQKGGRLSLWNTAYMNDDREGLTFLNILQDSAKAPNVTKIINACFPEANTSREYNDQPTFLGDNVYTTSLSLAKDNIPMWVAYADNGNGCMITYSMDYLNLRKDSHLPTDVSLYSDRDFPLYWVAYRSKGASDPNHCMIHHPDENKKRLEAMNESLKRICELLEKLPAFSPDSSEVNDVIHSFIRCCLSEVRFLVKDAEYAYEQEIRMCHYSKEYHLETAHSDIPRLYIELDQEVRLEEVVLGPKVNPYEEAQLRTWLRNTGKVDQVKHSERHYR